MQRRHPRRGPLWLILLLALVAFGQAIILFPMLFGGRGGAVGISRDVNLPEQEVRVFLARGDPTLLLKHAFDLPEADRSGAEEIDRKLFPGGDRHRYYFLHAIHGREGDVTLDLRHDTLTLEDGKGGVWASVDLESALRERLTKIPAYLALFLSSRLPEGGRVSLGPLARRTVLVAFRAEGLPESPQLARIGGRTLNGVVYSRKDELDRQLERPALLLGETNQ